MNSYETWVTSFVKNLADYFDFAGWTITIEFAEDGEDPSVYASTSVNSPYQHSTLTFYKESREDFKSGRADRLIMSVVHELVHIFLDPFQDYMHPHLSLTTTPLFMDMVENQTQKLTMVLLKSLPPDIIPPFPRSTSGKHNRTAKNNIKKPTVH